MLHRSSVLAALAMATSLALLCAPAAAQTIPPPETPVSTTSAPSTDVDTPTTAESPATVTADDRAFLTRALGDSERALAAVELAREHAVDERRPAVADRMAEQHEAPRSGHGVQGARSARSHSAARPA